jgi:16S rRNA (cytidine1402-2'-O)-methyltransferase
MNAHANGRLFLVPAPLDFGCDEQQALEASMPMQTLREAARLSHWICENAKSTRAYLKRIAEHMPLALPLQEQTLKELPRQVHKQGDHHGQFDARPLLAAAIQGHDMGLVSEAGMPAVADPGASVVRAAHALGIEVIPLVGPVSIMLALAASGLNGQSFAFVGYLPQDAGARAQRIRELETLALKSGQTQLFIETPYRNQALLQALLQTLKPQTQLAISSGLTLSRAMNRSMRVQTWKSSAHSLDKHTPALFAIGP